MINKTKQLKKNKSTHAFLTHGVEEVVLPPEAAKQENKTIPVRNKSGRPTKYKPEFCDEIITFFKRKPFELVRTAFGVKKVPNTLPTFHEFADTIGVNEDSIVEWAKEENKEKYVGFSAAYKKAKDLQKYFMVENALNGAYNPTAFIFVAKNITDMRDQKDVDLTSKGQKLGVVILPAEEE